MKAINYSIWHLHVQSQQKKKTNKQKKHYNNVSNISKVNIKNTSTMSGACIVNFEHISHIIILSLLLNSNKQMPVGHEKLFFQIISLFSVWAMGWENLIVGLHGFILIYPTHSFVLNCSRGLYCIFSNFSPPKLFYNDSPVLPKCEIRTYPHILLSIPLPYWAFLISQETENFQD